MNPPENSIVKVQAALKEARDYRHTWMTAVYDGDATPQQLFAAAASPGGRPLRRITLYQVLVTQDGWGPKRANDALGRLRRFTSPRSTRPLTVGWLIDPRSHGARLEAWVDAMESTRSGTPWVGFPWTKRPSHTLETSDVEPGR